MSERVMAGNVSKATDRRAQASTHSGVTIARTIHLPSVTTHTGHRKIW